MRKAIGAVCITVLCAALLTGCSNTAGSVSESLNEENSSSSQQSYSEEISDNESNDLIAEAEEALEQGRYEEAVEKSVKGYLMKEDSTGFETITLRVAEKLAEEQGFDNPMASKEETFDKKYYEIAIKCDSFKGKDIGTLSEEQLMFDAEVFKAFGRVFSQIWHNIGSNGSYIPFIGLGFDSITSHILHPLIYILSKRFIGAYSL